LATITSLIAACAFAVLDFLTTRTFTTLAVALLISAYRLTIPLIRRITISVHKQLPILKRARKPHEHWKFRASAAAAHAHWQEEAEFLIRSLDGKYGR
jgi:hypothetical protein